MVPGHSPREVDNLSRREVVRSIGNTFSLLDGVTQNSDANSLRCAMKIADNNVVRGDYKTEIIT